MGFIEKLVVVILIIVLIAWFAPNQYEWGKQTLLDRASDIIKNDYNFTQYDDGRDYGMILENIPCLYDSNCIDYFGIDGMECTNNNTCWLNAR